MPRALVVYASRHGGTEGIAERIADVLRGEGVETVLGDAVHQPDAAGFDAYVVGSGVYTGSWLKEAIAFIEKNQSLLGGRPVWLFSSGPLPHSTESADVGDPLEQALGPEAGPGSGGRKRIAALSAAIHARDHQVFLGAFDPHDPPKSLSERLIRITPLFKGVLPVGDFREWDAIEAWARTIAREVAAPIPVG